MAAKSGRLRAAVVPLILMANSLSNAKTAHDALAVTTALVAMVALCCSATAAFYINCAGCHTVPQSGVAIVNYQTTTNLDNDLRKVFKVSPGQTAVIQLSVTNNWCSARRWTVAINWSAPTCAAALCRA
jgi:hypothetical protein